MLFFCVSAMPSLPPPVFGFITAFFLNFMGFSSQRISNDILWIFLNVSIFGEGRTDNLYISCDSRRDFITVVFPNRISFRCPQIFIILYIFSIIGVMLLSKTSNKFGDTRIPNTLSGSFVYFTSRSVFTVKLLFFIWPMRSTSDLSKFILNPDILVNSPNVFRMTLMDSTLNFVKSWVSSVYCNIL